jgi:hypothetical protein
MVQLGGLWWPPMKLSEWRNITVQHTMRCLLCIWRQSLLNPHHYFSDTVHIFFYAACEAWQFSAPHSSQIHLSYFLMQMWITSAYNSLTLRNDLSYGLNVNSWTRIIVRIFSNGDVAYGYLQIQIIYIYKEYYLRDQKNNYQFKTSTINLT